MNQFATINEAARQIGLPAYRLRCMLKENRLPGWHAGSRFYVDTVLLRELLAAESQKAVLR